MDSKPENLPQSQIRDVEIAGRVVWCEILNASPGTIRLREIQLNRRIAPTGLITCACQRRSASVEVRVSVVKCELAIWWEHGGIDVGCETLEELGDLVGSSEVQATKGTSPLAPLR